MDIDGADFLARGITAIGPEGIVFEGIDLRVRPGELGVLTGPGGSGRTAMLLALSGRLRLASGHLEVSGHVLPSQARAVRQLVLPARLRPGFELDEQHTVRGVITERRLISGISRPAVDELLARVGVDPYPSDLIWELHPAERLLLSIALAAAAAPAAIVVDDVEAGLTAAGRTRVWTALRLLVQTGMTVIASSTEAPSGDAVVIRLPRPEYDEPTDVLAWGGGGW
ncbi:ATP-binding cassette domain-containing protein [Saccharopolyspora taberi]|uniref:ABC transporter domain-containing protein n=1 Tax=Saccharopolyspora taberi TaxID=60895 RepID=A0ABN3VC78_9PSEU